MIDEELTTKYDADNKLVPEDGEDYSIDDVLYYSKCQCGEELSWYDDCGAWYAECDKCGTKYDTVVSKVSVFVSEPDDDDEEDYDDDEEAEWAM